VLHHSAEKRAVEGKMGILNEKHLFINKKVTLKNCNANHYLVVWGRDAANFLDEPVEDAVRRMYLKSSGQFRSYIDNTLEIIKHFQSEP